MMNKDLICRLLTITYSITGSLTLLTYLWLLPDIQSVETDTFDNIKWLDADIFIINNILTPLLIITVLAIITTFVLRKFLK